MWKVRSKVRSKKYELGKTVDGFYYVRPQSWSKEETTNRLLKDGDCLFMSENIEDVIDFIISRGDINTEQVVFCFPYLNKAKRATITDKVREGIELALFLPEGSTRKLPLQLVFRFVRSLVKPRKE